MFLGEGTSKRQCKQRREKKFQAIMPLREKPLNTWKVESTNILVS